jgi:hypothetical protein
LSNSLLGARHSVALFVDHKAHERHGDGVTGGAPMA